MIPVLFLYFRYARNFIRNRRPRKRGISENRFIKWDISPSDSISLNFNIPIGSCCEFYIPHTEKRYIHTVRPAPIEKFQRNCFGR